MPGDELTKGGSSPRWVQRWVQPLVQRLVQRLHETVGARLHCRECCARVAIAGQPVLLGTSSAHTYGTTQCVLWQLIAQTGSNSTVPDFALSWGTVVLLALAYHPAHTVGWIAGKGKQYYGAPTRYTNSMSRCLGRFGAQVVLDVLENHR